MSTGTVIYTISCPKPAALHVITVWLREQSLVLSQSESAGKKNEIHSVASMEMLAIAHAAVSLDIQQSMRSP